MLGETDKAHITNRDPWNTTAWDGAQVPQDIFTREGSDENGDTSGVYVASWPSPEGPHDGGGKGEGKENKRNKDEDGESDGMSMRLMGLGTLCVVAGVSANVFAFRRSRWGVGKELHRAWERQQAYQAKQQSRASSSTSNGQNMGNSFARAAQDAFRNAASGRTAQAAREAAANAARVAAMRAAQAAAEAASRAAAQAAARAAKKQAEQGRGSGGPWGEARWETWTNGRRSSGRVTFDSDDWEEVIRQMQSGQGGGGGRRQSTRSDFDSKEWEELLRNLNASQGNRRRRMDDFDQMFEEMEKMFRAKNQGPAGFGGFGDFGDFGHSGGWPGGVHSRGDFGQARHYKALGLEPGADSDAVKQAYRKLVMQYHPDRYRGSDPEGAAKRFREVTQAYEALTKGI